MSDIAGPGKTVVKQSASMNLVSIQFNLNPPIPQHLSL